MNNREFIYGFDVDHRVIESMSLFGNYVCTRTEKYVAARMIRDNPDVKRVYKIDDRAGLYLEWNEGRDSTQFTKWFEFENTVAYEGLLIAERK